MLTDRDRGVVWGARGVGDAPRHGRPCAGHPRLCMAMTVRGQFGLPMAVTITSLTISVAAVPVQPASMGEGGGGEQSRQKNGE